jgi:anti-sigma factor RsiW
MSTMDKRSTCPDPELLNALLDHELDAARVLHVERHVAECATCGPDFAGLQQISRLVRRAEVRYEAPEGLRDRILEAIATEPHRAAGSVPTAAPIRRALRQEWWRRSFLFPLAPAVGLLAAIALAVVLPRGERAHPGLTDEVVAGHVRSLMVDHLTDVASSDRHTVKPWFSGKVDFAPPVVDLADRDFRLTGGRLDYIGGRPVAALVYGRRAHVINVFVSPTGAIGPSTLTHDGFNVVRWHAGDLTFWAVSDLNPKELEEFGAQFRQRTP